MTTIDMRVRNIITMLAPDNRMEPVSPSETLESLGFDSLDRFEMTAKIEEEFSIDIEDGVPEAWVTVQDVIDSVLNEIGPTSENIADVLKDHYGFEETPALAEIRDYCNEKLTPEQYEKERAFDPQPPAVKGSNNDD